MSRRSTFTDQSVTYGAIGATLDPDFLRYPPDGFLPAEDSVKLGSGAERFERAAEQLMTWGVQQGSGFTVTEVSPGTGAQYSGLAFDPEGSPLSTQPAQRTEPRFAADGTPFITAGMAPEAGEESFILERRDDDTVWLTVRSILEPAGGLRRLAAPLQHRRRR